MGNLQVRFLEGWAPAMAPGYSTMWFLALRHELASSTVVFVNRAYQTNDRDSYPTS